MSTKIVKLATKDWASGTFQKKSEALAIGTSEGTAFDGKAGSDLSSAVSDLQSQVGDIASVLDSVNGEGGV